MDRGPPHDGAPLLLPVSQSKGKGSKLAVRPFHCFTSQVPLFGSFQLCMVYGGEVRPPNFLVQFAVVAVARFNTLKPQPPRT